MIFIHNNWRLSFRICDRESVYLVSTRTRDRQVHCTCKYGINPIIIYINFMKMKKVNFLFLMRN